jgi:hypothetical protein
VRSQIVVNPPQNAGAINDQRVAHQPIGAKARVTAPLVAPFLPPINDPISLYVPVPQRYSRQAKHNQNLRQKSSRLLPFSDTDGGVEDGCPAWRQNSKTAGINDSRPTRRVL